MSAISSRLSFLPLLASFSAFGPTSASPDLWDVAVRTCSTRIPAALQRHGQFGCPAALDEQTALLRGPGAWSPWTHPPVCVNASLVVDGASTSGPAVQKKKQYCVYTNALHGIDGLSVVTTPEAAAASLDLLDEVEYPHPTRRRKHNNHDATQQPAAYEIVDLPGRGKGVVATRAIAQYEEFMVDYAALVIDLQFPEAVARDDGYRLLDRAADQLSAPQRVRGLAQTSTAARNAVENVLRSNAFHTVMAGANHMALFPDLARINHACMPNAFPRFRPYSLAVSVAAAREIQPGEEITISYIIVGQTREDRQKALLRWEFVCTCPLCSASAEAIQDSDGRRTHIEHLRNQAVTAFQDGDAYESLRITRELFPLLRQEEMFSVYSEQYENIGRIYWVLGERDKAQFYAQKSLDTLAEQGYISEADRQKVHILLYNYEHDI